MARRRKRKSQASGALLGAAVALVLLLAVVGRLLQAIQTEPLLGIPGIVLTLVGLTAVVMLVRNRNRTKARTLADLLALTPGQFEEATANLLRDLGYRDVRRTGGAGDLNVDVSATDPSGQRIAVQCKQYNAGHNVGSPEVQTFIGMIYQHHRAANGIFVTTSRFSTPAIKLAQENAIALWDGDELARRLIQVRANRDGTRGRTGPIWAYASLPLGVLLLSGAWLQSGQTTSLPAVTAASVAPLMAPIPTAGATSAVTVTPPAVGASATTVPQTVQVANTGGEGVYLRRTPTMDDKLRAYQDGTRLTVVGPDVVGDGLTWRHVEAPDHTEGYVPSQYVEPAA